MGNLNELWYAARRTRIVYMPHKLLETFGETAVHYSLVTERQEGLLCLRTGVVKAARPRIITPHYLASQALANFGEDARKYFEDLLSRQEGAGILQYGLAFEKEEQSEQTISGNSVEVAEQIARTAQDNLSEIRGVLLGDERHWEIALVFFLKLLVNQSAPINAREMAGRGMFARHNGIPLGISDEIDADFHSCTTRQQADALGNKLRDYGIFDAYEDRFFQLYSRFC